MRWLLVLILLVCCTKKTGSPAIIIWENEKAVAVSLEETDSLKIYREGSSYPVLGNMKNENDRSLFTPVVPFERGQSYRTSSGITFNIPPDSTARAPELVGSFPSCDTVPSNLLKIYLQFSEPMSEGRSSQHIQLFDATTGDTVKSAFLDLQPELWNEDGTVLTLWLDPGRIKQDLIPNKKLGFVMNDNRTYRLVIAKGWKSKKGLALEQDYNKTFVTSKRDTGKPNINSWSIDVRGDTVIVDLKESLDWSLLRSAVSVMYGDDEITPQTITGTCETKLALVFGKLPSGEYRLNVESRLEDLAGNSLNRLFETDVTASSNNSEIKDTYTLHFRVK
jgi:hypothetical protein